MAPPRKDWDANKTPPNEKAAILKVENGIRGDINKNAVYGNDWTNNEVTTHRTELEIAAFRYALKGWNTKDIKNPGKPYLLRQKQIQDYVVELVMSGIEDGQIMENAKVTALQQLANLAFTPPAPGTWSVPASCAILSLAQLRAKHAVPSSSTPPTAASTSVTSVSLAASTSSLPSSSVVTSSFKSVARTPSKRKANVTNAQTLSPSSKRRKENEKVGKKPKVIDLTEDSEDE